MSQGATRMLNFSNLSMLFKALLFLLIITGSQAVAFAAEPDLSWFTNGNPYQIAARCYGAILLNPSTEFNGEPEILISIIASDPHLKADALMNNSLFAQPTERGKSLDLIGRNIHFTVRMMQSENFSITNVKKLCGNFIERQR